MATDSELVQRLRAGDVQAFDEIVASWSPAMLHVARYFVASHASAEEAVQETWLAMIRGLEGFEGRSSVKTWVFHILANVSRRQGVTEKRVVASGLDDETGRPAIDPARFRPAGDRWAGGWLADATPQAWGPEASALGHAAMALIMECIHRLPQRQRAVIELRDVSGLTAAEACVALDLTAANQRVLLHRARSAVRQALEDYYDGRGGGHAA